MRALISTAMLLSSGIACAQQTATSSSSVVHRQGSILHVTTNSSFQYVQIGNTSLLLKAVQRNEVNFEADGIQGTLKVTAWRMIGDKPGAALWSFQSEGNEGAAFSSPSLYRATSWPCCSAMWVYEYFSLINGAHLYTTNGGVANDGVNDQGLKQITGHAYKDERFVAFGASYQKDHETPTLQYGTDTAIKQRFQLKGHAYGDNFDVPEMLLLDEHGAKVRDLPDALTFTIVLRFEEADDQPAAELRIPVIDDAIVPGKSVLPKGYSLVAVKPKR